MFVTVVLPVAGIVLLIFGADLLVKGASRLASGFGMSALVVGLTVVAVGTSSPEIAVTVLSASRGEADLAVGNVVGSNITNILLIAGVSALFGALVVGRTMLRFHVPVMLVVTCLAMIMALDGTISRTDGLLLLAGFAAYVIASIRIERGAHSVALEPVATSERPSGRSVVRHLCFIIVGLGGLLLGSHWIVAGAVAVAEALGVSKLVVGLTIVAVGTSLPEIATSVMATYRGEREIALGNIVGSNIANILLVLGVGGVAAGSEGLSVSRSMLGWDLPFAVLVAGVCLPVFWNRMRVTRVEGLLLLVAYIAFVVQAVLGAYGFYVGAIQVCILGYICAVACCTAIRGVQAMRALRGSEDLVGK